MPDSTDPLYRDQDIHAILKRAAELQHTEATVPSEYDGLSLSELQQVAAEAGIDPQYVEAAVAERERTSPDKSRFQIWGAPVQLTRERVLDGPVSEAAWQEMIAMLQQTYNGPGEVRHVGQTLEWSRGKGDADNAVLVSIAEREGSTRIRLISNYSNKVAAAHAPLLTVAFFLGLIVVGSIESWLWAPLAFVAIFGVFFAAARMLFRYLARHQRDKADDVMQRLARIASSEKPTGTHAVRAPTATEQTPAIDLPDERETPDAVANPNRHRTRS